MSLPSGISFSTNGNFATSPSVFDANHNGGTPFTGPSLWSSDPSIYAQPSGGNGSHIDMLHENPNALGIESEEKNIFYDVPNLVSTPEINIPVSDEKKFEIVEKFIENSHFDDALIIDIDGIRVEFERGWGLLRASNTSPVLVLRFEAETENDLENIKNLFNQNLKSIDPELIIF